MATDNGKLDDLKKELSNLRQDFYKRINEIERQIEFFETQQQKKLDFESRSQMTKPLGGFEQLQQNEPKVEKAPAVQIQSSEESSDILEAPVPAPACDTPHTESMSDSASNKTEFKESVFTGFAENTLPVFGPLAASVTKVAGVYKHYQSQGKAPAFFMTIAGILTLVMGFGYLLQYSFSQFLGPVGKVSIGFLTAFGIIIAGVVIHRKKKEMEDYASSLIGLGVILCYLCAYFSVSFYHLISESVSIVLLCIITAGAYFLALKFRTRVVAIVSLLGGAFAPLLMAGVDQSYYIYLTYFFILVCSTLHLSRRINWPTLAHFCLILMIGIIEYLLNTLGNLSFSPLGFILFIHLFFYVFVTYNCLELLKNAGLNKPIIISFSSNLFFFLFALYQAVHWNNSIGWYYCGNAIFFLSAFFSSSFLLKSKKENVTDNLNQIRMIFVLSAGILAGFAVLAIVGYEFMGLSWGVEALLLLYMGLVYRIIQVRIEAFVILILALVFSFYHASVWMVSSLVPPPEIFRLSFGYGWMNLLVCSGLLWPAILMVEKKKKILTQLENKFVFVSNEILSVFLSLLFFMTVAIFWAQGPWLLCIIPMFFFIHRANKKSLYFTEYFGLGHFLLLLIPIFISAQIAGNFFFVEQVTIGKIARIEIFLCLFLLAEFYQRFNNKSVLAVYAPILRIVFWCIIPVSFLPGIWHQHVYFFPLGMWLSAGICLALFYWLKYPALLLELKLIVISACLGSVIACAMVEFFGWKGHGLLALFSGLIFLGATLICFNGLKKDSTVSEDKVFYKKSFQLLFSLFFYYFGVFLFITIYGFTGSSSLAFSILTGYFFSLLFKSQRIEPLKMHTKLLYLIVGINCVLISVVFLFFCSNGFSTVSGANDFLFKNGVFNILLVIILGLSVHLNIPHFKEARKNLGGELNHFRFFHLLCGLIYIGILSHWFKTEYGPALSVAFVMHATIVLFLTLKPRFQKLISIAVLIYGLAAGKIILWDMGDFSIIQKVIAFIIIGILLLAGAYQYQKRRSAILEAEDLA